MGDTDRDLKFYSDNYESHFKGANYLLVAHGAGFLGCLAILKDYATSPQYKGVGIFIVLFGLGLIASTTYYIALSFSRATALNIVMDIVQENEASTHFLTKCNFVSSCISTVLFLGAVFALMWKFFGL